MLGKAETNFLRKSCGGDGTHIRHDDTILFRLVDQMPRYYDVCRYVIEREQGAGLLKYGDNVYIQKKSTGEYLCPKEPTRFGLVSWGWQ